MIGTSGIKVELIQAPADAAMICGRAAAICTATSNYASSLKHSVGSGHDSVLEHAVYTFRVEGISRACLAQLTRHRVASYSVQSQRYAGIQNADLVMPESVMKSGFREDVESLMKETMALYDKLIEVGVPKEDARYITPQAVPTALIFSMNARELRHFFSLRCCNRAQWEIRDLADEMLRLCRENCPTIFEDSGPGCVRGACPEKKPCGHPRKEVKTE